MNIDNKLLQNNIDEINRLNEQLKDLETYKDDFDPEELESMRKETLAQLDEAKKRLEKMKSGSLTTKTSEEEENMKRMQSISENYNVKGLTKSYDDVQVSTLREKLKGIIRANQMNKLTKEEYSSSVIEILEIIAKNTKLNEEEQRLYDSLKKTNLKHLQEDTGIDKNKIEKQINKGK
jgi:uncharacterized protein YdcH (DUF465 family)